MPTEILIADDGSKPETRRMVERFAALSSVPIRHIWHEDNGFRLAAIRNKAIAASIGEYIVQIDGDVILQRNFIRDHMAFAQKGFYTSGSRSMLSEEMSRHLLDRKEHHNLGPLHKGVRNRLNVLREPLLAKFYRQLGIMRGVKGCNMAFWRDDLVRVNGYNEEFVGWGGEDTELATRLHAIGVRQQCMKFMGGIFHIYHPQTSRENRAKNTALLRQSIHEAISRCQKGLDAYLSNTEALHYPTLHSTERSAKTE